MRCSVSEPGGCEETCLHSNHGINEKDHGDEQTDVGQSLRTVRDVCQRNSVEDAAVISGECLTDLEGLDKGPEERSDAFAFAEQLHQPQHAEQAEEGDGHFPTFPFALRPQHKPRCF